MTATPEPALRFRNLSKTFGGQRALADVDFELRRGEVCGLLGQNGSGKSTLIKILAGYHSPDPGSTLEVGGVPVPLPLPPGRFRDLGISFVHQHLGLIPALRVVENLAIGRIAASSSLALSWRTEAAQAARVFARYGLALDPWAEVSGLSAVERALLAIVRAVEEVSRHRQAHHGGVLVLDEPTPFLPKQDVDRLFALIRAIVAEGASVIFVSHDVDEVMEITDRATVLRDGHVAGTIETAHATRDEVVRLIVGRMPAAAAPAATTQAGRAESIFLDDVTGRLIDRVSLRIAGGEVVGVTGLLGSGYEELPYLLYGGRPARAGTLMVDGRTRDLTRLTPGAAVSCGIVLIPGDRAAAGSIAALPVVDNVTMPMLGRRFHRFWLARGRMLLEAAALGRRFDVTPNRPELLLAALSGGNAQKVVLAKWLQTDPKLILLDEPTQGVDVGARFKVFQAIRAAAEGGAAVLCASSDYEQLASICHRVLILSRGHVIAELSGEHLSKEAIAEACYRSSAPPPRVVVHAA